MKYAVVEIGDTKEQKQKRVLNILPEVYACVCAILQKSFFLFLRV
jgi:peroxiredoxin